jgi:hypothetical protein
VRVRLPGAHGAVEELPAEHTAVETMAEMTTLPGLRGHEATPLEYPRLAVAG